MNLQVRRKGRPQGKKPSKILYVRNITDPSITVPLQNELSRCLEQISFTKGETEENWAKLRNEVGTAAKKTIEVLKRHHQDLFDDNGSEIQSLLAEKYAAYKDWLADKQSESKRDKFHHLRGKVQKRLRSMNDEWWKKKAGEIKGYADSKNAKLFYSSLREVYGPPQRSSAPVWNPQGELLTDNEAINKRWTEHFEQLLNRLSSIDPSVIDENPARTPHMELDNPLTEDEVTEAIAELQSGKSAGSYGIPPEVFKADSQPLIQKFTEFVCMCWEDGCLLQDLKDARIVHLCKGKCM